MAVLPIRDRVGNVLIDVRFPGEAEHADVPASLVVVVHAHAVLMMFDSRRRQWELPGGMREHGESPHQTAVRELREETGIRGAGLTFAGVAEFDLVAPPRRELLAVYRGELQVVPRLVVNDEALGFRWWRPSEPVSGAMSPLDAEIARRVFRHGRDGETIGR
ncbi:NUDIX domain-containing protein [Lentzea xinjiangensis]|uniref:NUDIX domain-containing protein n=1 Tax=Lentzea xinjiangensis TaxID=402600 RepID=A0A1H9E4U5_9PSEU|nr:NUDIX hydrolase [Lentzea xinjiangensis]SEQ20750.1 NUDIX domain-containing protein [Lentzea xinjiangensis]